VDADLSEVWARIVKQYPNVTLDMQAEEVFTYIAEQVKPGNTTSPRRAGSIIESLLTATGAGLTGDGAFELARSIAAGMKTGERKQQNFPRTPQSLFRQDDAMSKIEKMTFADKIAAELIDRLEAGTAPWQIPFKPGEAWTAPYNAKTGQTYRGANSLWLGMQGHDDPRWLTYNQAKDLGAQVRKGAHGATIQYYKFVDEKVKRDDKGMPVKGADGKSEKETSRRERPIISTAVVFNASQIDGLPPLPKLDETAKPFINHAAAEHILKESGAEIQFNDRQGAFYHPGRDFISLPNKGRFVDESAFYATALHELGHWTGHESRLARDMSGGFGSINYAKEELRAEISSMMVGRELNIGHDPGQHAAYVKSWVSVLKDDPKEILRAAADAEKIRNMVMNYARDLERQQEQEKALQDELAREAGQGVEIALVETPDGNESLPAPAQMAVQELTQAQKDELALQADMREIGAPIPGLSVDDRIEAWRGQWQSRAAASLAPGQFVVTHDYYPDGSVQHSTMRQIEAVEKAGGIVTATLAGGRIVTFDESRHIAVMDECEHPDMVLHGRNLIPEEQAAWLSAGLNQSDLRLFDAIGGADVLRNDQDIALRFQDTTDAALSGRINAVRNELRVQGWDGERYGQLSKDGVAFNLDAKHVGAGANLAALDYVLAPLDGQGQGLRVEDRMNDAARNIAVNLTKAAQAIAKAELGQEVLNELGEGARIVPTRNGKQDLLAGSMGQEDGAMNAQAQATLDALAVLSKDFDLRPVLQAQGAFELRTRDERPSPISGIVRDDGYFQLSVKGVPTEDDFLSPVNLAAEFEGAISQALTPARLYSAQRAAWREEGAGMRQGTAVALFKFALRGDENMMRVAASAAGTAFNSSNAINMKEWAGVNSLADYIEPMIEAADRNGPDAVDRLAAGCFAVVQAANRAVAGINGASGDEPRKQIFDASVRINESFAKFFAKEKWDDYVAVPAKREFTDRGVVGMVMRGSPGVMTMSEAAPDAQLAWALDLAQGAFAAADVLVFDGSSMIDPATGEPLAADFQADATAEFNALARTVGYTVEYDDNTLKGRLGDARPRLRHDYLPGEAKQAAEFLYSLPYGTMPSVKLGGGGVLAEAKYHTNTGRPEYTPYDGGKSGSMLVPEFHAALIAAAETAHVAQSSPEQMVIRLVSTSTEYRERTLSGLLGSGHQREPVAQTPAGFAAQFEAYSDMATGLSGDVMADGLHVLVGAGVTPIVAAAWRAHTQAIPGWKDSPERGGFTAMESAGRSVVPFNAFTRHGPTQVPQRFEDAMSQNRNIRSGYNVEREARIVQSIRAGTIERHLTDAAAAQAVADVVESMEPLALSNEFWQRNPIREAGPGNRAFKEFAVQLSAARATIDAKLTDYANAAIEAAPAAPERAQSAQDTQARTYLAVPYRERLEAKAAGAGWDVQAKKWFVKDTANLDKLSRWFETPTTPAVQQSPTSQFRDALQGMGFELAGHELVATGQGTRCKVVGDKGKAESGFYTLHADAKIPAGYIKNHRTGAEQFWKTTSAAYAPETLATFNKDAQAARDAAQIERLQLQQKAAATIQKAIDTQQIVPLRAPTPYQVAKKIQPQPGAYTDAKNQVLHIPVYDAAGDVRTMQSIDAEGQKRFRKDGAKSGNFHVIGGMDALAESDYIGISEGYATGCTIYEAMRAPTAVAFDAGNIAHVAEALHAKYPDKPIVIFGDDDKGRVQEGLPNRGREAAEAAAAKVGGIALFPIIPGDNPSLKDWNDLASVAGADMVREQIECSAGMMPILEAINTRDAAQESLIQENAQEQAVSMSL